MIGAILSDMMDIFIEQLAAMDIQLTDEQKKFATGRTAFETGLKLHKELRVVEAAPELLAACEKLLARLELEGSGKKETWHAIDTARDVIARAKEHQ